MAEAQSRRERVIIRLPKNWFGGKQTFFALGLPATPENLAIGARTAAQINLDYSAGKFDRTLQSYRPTIEAPPIEKVTVLELWQKYCQYKRPRWKAKTRDYYERLLFRHVLRMPQDWERPLDIRDWLVKETTPGVAARVLNTLEAVLAWAIRCRLVLDQRNPFERMGRDLEVLQSPSPANACSPAEETAVIAEFYSHPKLCSYGPFVEFLFLTGCRPSEAVGLVWGNVAIDLLSIVFDRSIVRIQGQVVRNQLSKTNRSRAFPASSRLTEFLSQCVRKIDSALVFSGPAGEPINYEHFSRVAWPKVVEPLLERKSTPYCCRDTFITRQIAEGKPPAVIARWVDNSIGMIEKKYLDVSAIKTVLPE